MRPETEELLMVTEFELEGESGFFLIEWSILSGHGRRWTIERYHSIEQRNDMGRL